MSSDSPEKKALWPKPWHVDESVLEAARDRASQLFDDKFFSDLAKKIKPAPVHGQQALQDDLRDMARAFLTATLTSPLGLAGGSARATLDQRRRWLKANAVNPAVKLIDALTNEAHMLSDWPEEFKEPSPDRAALLDQLHRLKLRAENLMGALKDRMKDKNEGPTTMKAELASALTDVFEMHFPGLRAARDGYDRSGQAFRSPYPTFVALCVNEIFGKELDVPGNLLDDNANLRGHE